MDSEAIRDRETENQDTASSESNECEGSSAINNCQLIRKEKVLNHQKCLGFMSAMWKTIEPHQDK